MEADSGMQSAQKRLLKVAGKSRKLGSRTGCSTDSTRGSSICSNSKTISEKRVSHALTEALVVLLDDDKLLAILEKSYEDTSCALAERGNDAAYLRARRRLMIPHEIATSTTPTRLAETTRSGGLLSGAYPAPRRARSAGLRSLSAVEPSQPAVR